MTSHDLGSANAPTPRMSAGLFVQMFNRKLAVDLFRKPPEATDRTAEEPEHIACVVG